ncbi:type II secretion system protein GspL [Sphingomonas japonica]|nr:type II secretion system protein GspL [Sphingomonas japonica]
MTATAPASAAVGDDRAGGVWTLAANTLIINEAGGPATILVPSEAVRTLAVDLPLNSRAKRIAALPFAIEDRIADPLDVVHLALGAELAPKRFLVGIVRHDAMARWTALADAAGLGQAAFVPDALALPRPAEGVWTVASDGDRALVRSGDGTGFATPVELLPAAWEAAGRPQVIAHGVPLPAAIDASIADTPLAPIAERVAAPAIDLRQGLYARRRAALPHHGRRLAWILGIGALAHSAIAAADTWMLHTIAERRAYETRVLLATASPGASTDREGLAERVVDLLPEPTRASPFVPLLTQVSGALAPLASSIAIRSMAFEGSALVVDIDPLQPGAAGRITGAMQAARIAARVVEAPDGSIRLTAGGTP